MSPSFVYLLYADDGATLVYSGADGAEYERHCRALAPAYAGSLVGRRRTGRVEQWIVRAFFRAPPAASFVASRRHGFPYGLAWEPAETTMAEAAGEQSST